VDAAGRARLIEYSDTAIRERAHRLFQSDTSDLAKLVQSYQNVVYMAGNPARGKAKFELWKRPIGAIVRERFLSPQEVS
jgi:hypothetical protein